jgi:hypothetical protein
MGDLSIGQRQRLDANSGEQVGQQWCTSRDQSVRVSTTRGVVGMHGPTLHGRMHTHHREMSRMVPNAAEASAPLRRHNEIMMTAEAGRRRPEMNRSFFAETKPAR